MDQAQRDEVLHRSLLLKAERASGSVDTARCHHRSLTKEIIFALEQHVRQPSHDKTELLQRIRAVRDRYPPNIDESDVDGWKGIGRP